MTKIKKRIKVYSTHHLQTMIYRLLLVKMFSFHHSTGPQVDSLFRGQNSNKKILVIFFVLNVFKVYYFIGAMKLSTAETINAVSNKTQEESDAMAESMATKFGAVQLLGVFIAPINGYIIDNSKFLIYRTGNQEISTETCSSVTFPSITVFGLQGSP